MEALIRPFSSIGKNDAGLAGGKGASLGEMTQAGIPVPPGFVVSAPTFDRFIEETDLNVEIDAILGTVKHEEIHTVEHASAKIQALILSAKMPEDIGQEILAHFKELGAEYVAVRSSATAEDSASAAWAGQLDTFLNTTEAELLTNVQKCWASLFTPRAIFYRFETGLHATKISVAVVVQKMVNSEASGIAFSVHPVTEDRNQLIIEAGWGLGEAIVSGQITPDAYVVTKSPKVILDKNIATKERGLFRKEGGGNDWKEVVQEKREAQTLTDEEILTFSDLIVRIEKHYGFPCDIEWAMEGGEMYITQSRPITTLSPEEPKEENFKTASPAGAGEASARFDVIAQDFRSPFIRNWIWTDACRVYATLFDTPAPVMGIVSHRDEIQYFADLDTFRKAHEGLVEKALKDHSFVEQLIDATNSFGESFNAWSEREIYQDELGSKTPTELMALLKEFSAKQSELYAYGFTLPILDFGGFAFVEGNLARILKEQCTPEEYTTYYETFTQPTRASFAQEQEMDLLRLMVRHKALLPALLNIDLHELETKYPAIYEDLMAHTERHGWVYYTYKGPATTPEQFLEFIKDAVQAKVEPDVKLKEIEAEQERVSARKEEYLTKMSLNVFDEAILRLAGKMVWAKPRRKDYQSKSYFHLERLLAECAKRMAVSLESMRALPFPLIERGLGGEVVDVSVSSDIFKQHVCVLENGEAVIYRGEDATTFSAQHVRASHVHTASSGTELRGTTAKRGKARGKVKIVNVPEDMVKMEKGDILVSIATSPSVVPAMKKAAAILSDEGGLTCHAAIVSRELGIPCIVGLKNATVMLKDEDVVEVDADTGFIRKVNNISTEEAMPFAHAWDASYWVQIGRWVQTPFTYSFFLEWAQSASAQRLYPSRTFGSAFTVDGYFHVAKADLTFIEKDLIEKQKDGTLKDFLETFDAIGKGLEVQYRSLFDTGAVSSRPLSEILELHNQLNGFWSFVTLIGDSVNGAALTSKLANSEADFMDLVHPHLRISWIEDEDMRVRAIAQKVLTAGVEEVTTNSLSELRAKDSELDALISSYEATYAWLGISKWEGEPHTKEQFTARIHEAVQNTKAGNYIEKHGANTPSKEPMIELAASTAYWRATCSGLAEELAFHIRERIAKLGDTQGLSYNDCLLLSFRELAELETKNILSVSKNELHTRAQGYAIYYEPGKKMETVTQGSSVYEQLRSTYAKPPARTSEELRGVIARKGKVTGRACVVTGNSDFAKFKEGDVLIAPETTPAYVPLMRKAVAILTERGGITSHAAIVSRELKKPCIISITGLIATLSDGDMIEVDANMGVVRKI